MILGRGERSLWDWGEVGCFWIGGVGVVEIFIFNCGLWCWWSGFMLDSNSYKLGFWMKNFFFLFYCLLYGVCFSLMFGYLLD